MVTGIKLKAWQIVFCCLVLTFVLPLSGLTQPQALSEEQLLDVSGQSGVFLLAGEYDLKWRIKTVFYGDDGGEDDNLSPACLSINGLQARSRVSLSSPLYMDSDFGPLFDSDHALSGGFATWQSMQIDLEHLSVQSITVGSRPGEGKSFGSIGLQGMQMEISGQVQRWAH